MAGNVDDVACSGERFEERRIRDMGGTFGVVGCRILAVGLPAPANVNDQRSARATERQRLALRGWARGGGGHS
jgi:chloramphenicol 3-O-phosphotransferase